MVRQIYCSIIIDSLSIFSFLVHQIYFQKNVPIQKTSIYQLQAKTFTVSDFSNNHSKSFSTVSFEITVCNVLINSQSTLFIVNFNNLLSIIDQIFSIIFISELFSDQIICLMHFLFKVFDPGRHGNPALR